MYLILGFFAKKSIIVIESFLPYSAPMLLRTAATLTLILFVFFAPWWVTMALAIALTFVIDSYYELLAIGALMDLLYGVPGEFTTGYGVIGFIASGAVLLAVEKIKKELR